METYLTQIAEYLLTQSWQIAVLVVVVAAATFALRNRSAHVRYLLWLIVLAKCLTPPLLEVPVAVLPERAPKPSGGGEKGGRRAGVRPGPGAASVCFPAEGSGGAGRARRGNHRAAEGARLHRVALGGRWNVRRRSRALPRVVRCRAWGSRAGEGRRGGNRRSGGTRSRPGRRTASGGEALVLARH